MALNPSPLRLVTPASGRRSAADAALVEAVLDGLPPAGRVHVVGPEGWLAEALAALGVEVGGEGLVDAVVAVGTPGAEEFAAARAALDLGGRLVLSVAHPYGEQPGRGTLGGWVRLVGDAGLVLRDVREPRDADGRPAALILVCEG